MRTTIVPAQITTVEDKIAGNLGLSQILLLIAPVFGGSGIFVILPPYFNYALYKVVLVSLVTLLCGLLAVRIKGKIVLFWMISILRYNIRPAYYVYNKNSTHNRELSTAVTEDESTESEPVKAKRPLIPALNVADRITVEHILINPAANVHFTTTKKGVIRVHLTEVTREGLSQTAN